MIRFLELTGIYSTVEAGLDLEIVQTDFESMKPDERTRQTLLIGHMPKILIGLRGLGLFNQLETRVGRPDDRTTGAGERAFENSITVFEKLLEGAPRNS